MATKEERKTRWEYFWVGAMVSTIVTGVFITLVAYAPSSKIFEKGYKKGQIDYTNGIIKYVPDTTITTTIKYLKVK